MDAVGWVTVLPANRTCVDRIGVDIAATLAGQVRHRSKDTASNDIPFDLGEPEFHLVEPGRVGGREVKMDSRVLL